jgi:hypothetical protein
MAKLEIKREFPGVDSGECYQASLRMVEKAGYQIFKKREIASLVMGEGKFEGNNISLNVVIPFGFPISVVITLFSETDDVTSLRLESDRLFALLEDEL